MAGGQVSARIQGDLYQGLFFWKEASQLLKNPQYATEVTFECDEAGGVDDLVVHYGKTKIQDSLGKVDADYYQIKFHVDKTHKYTSDNFIDPDFIKRKQSLLQRFYESYKKLNSEGKTIRLLFASNWDWDQEEILGKKLRETNGELPSSFFNQGKGSALGSIREKWRAHLKIDETEFKHFAKTLRFEVNCLARNQFMDLVCALLENVGLKPIAKERINNPYHGIYVALVAEQKNKFNNSTFYQLCKDEDLFFGAIQAQPLQPLGIRSFYRFAEKLEEETSSSLCLLSFFEGRHLRDGYTWLEVYEEIKKFFELDEVRANAKKSEFVHLDCHLSIAFLAGYEVDYKSGIPLFPIQKGGAEVFWKPKNITDSNWSINQETISNSSGQDHVVILSIARDAKDDVLKFVQESSLNYKDVTSFTIPEGFGHVIKSADHAKWIATEIVNSLKKIKVSNLKARTHLFAACPNSLIYFLGQQREALGAITLYEFDFSNESNSSYKPSISLPV